MHAVNVKLTFCDSPQSYGRLETYRGRPAQSRPMGGFNLSVASGDSLRLPCNFYKATEKQRYKARCSAVFSVCAKTIKKHVNAYAFKLRKVSGEYAPGAVVTAQLPAILDQFEISYGWKYGYDPIDEADIAAHGSLLGALNHHIADGAEVYLYLPSIDERLEITAQDLG